MRKQFQILPVFSQAVLLSDELDKDNNIYEVISEYENFKDKLHLIR